MIYLSWYCYQCKKVHTRLLPSDDDYKVMRSVHDIYFNVTVIELSIVNDLSCVGEDVKLPHELD